MILNNKSLLFCLFIVSHLYACGAASSGGPGKSGASAAGFFGEKKPNRDDSTRTADTSKTDATKADAKAPADQKAVVRKTISNLQEKAVRTQANLARSENLRNSALARRDQTKAEYAQVSAQSPSSSTTTNANGTTTTTVSNPGRTKAELNRLLIKQNEEIAEMDVAIKAAKDELDALELQIDELTKQL
jgi:hypothetical protein